MPRKAANSIELRHSCWGTGVRSESAEAQEPIRFGEDFEVDVRTCELRHVGRALKLERIPMQVLLFLIEQKGQLVTRQEIVEKIWGKDVFLDTDNSINGAVRKIRQVLKDDPEQPRFVQTITGRGYRFIAPIAEQESRPIASEATQSAPAQEKDREKVQSAQVPAENGNKTGKAAEAVATGTKRRARLVLSLCSFCAIGLATWMAWQHSYGERATRPIRSIAVLPLQNLSGDATQEYFSDGMTEELITEMSRIQALKVISHTSVMEYKGTKKHLPQIARELGVDGIVEGSVIRENDQVRVTVQLLDGPNDRHLWSEDYQRPLHGILNLQREVAQAIAQQIRIKLTPQQQVRLTSARAVNPEAYEAYLRGRYYLSNQFTMAQPLNLAKSCFEESVRKDPGFALAYSGLADSYVYLAFFHQLSPDAAYRSAKEALRKALELDDSIGEAHDTLGLLSWRFEWDWDAAEREFNHAIALAPSYSCAHEDRAIYLSFIGRRAEALAEIAKSSEMDPGPSSAMAESSAYYLLRDYAALIEASRRGVISYPNEWTEHYGLGIGYEGTGKQLEAIFEYQKAVEMSDGDQDATATLAHAYATIGRRAEAEKILRDLERKSKRAYVSPYIIATIYAGLGKKDRAFEFLEKAYQERSLEISWHLKADPRIDNLRSDARLQALLRRVGLPK
jgi:TolB-like protein/DNA-binding winged helix-turn-helix (wHTH) protein/Flp pilus assembly protein TadD